MTDPIMTPISSPTTFGPYMIANGIMKTLKIKDPMIETFVQYGLLLVVTSMLSNVPSFISSVWRRLTTTVMRIYTGIRRFTKRKDKSFHKEVAIEYITEQRTINELYKAVHWYLTSKFQSDFVGESPVTFMFDEKIEQNAEKFDIKKETCYGRAKTIEYDGMKIAFSFSKDLKTIYGEKESKKENNKITLSATYPNSKCDKLSEFCNMCLKEYSDFIYKHEQKRFIYTNENGEWKQTELKSKRKIDTIILRNGIQHDIKGDLELFLKSEQWYGERDIPYRRGYLFYGSPGTGKTSMIKAISTHTNRSIHYLVFSDVKSDTELFKLLKGIDYTKTILVIEDIDCATSAIKNRAEENKPKTEKKEEELLGIIKTMVTAKTEREPTNKQENALTLSGILNVMDGIFEAEGRIIIATTNKPETLDKALIRPGRFDRAFLFEKCDRQQIANLYKMFFDKECDLRKLEHIDEDRFSPCQIVSLFLTYRTDPSQALSHIMDVEKIDVWSDTLGKPKNVPTLRSYSPPSSPPPKPAKPENDGKIDINSNDDEEDKENDFGDVGEDDLPQESEIMAFVKKFMDAKKFSEAKQNSLMKLAEQFLSQGNEEETPAETTTKTSSPAKTEIATEFKEVTQKPVEQKS